MIPEGWKQVRLSDLIFFGEAGISVNSEDRRKQEGELGILKTSSVTYGKFKPLEHKTIVKSEENRATAKPKTDCILISRMNTLELVGASAYVDQDYDDLFLPDRLWQAERKSDHCSMKWLNFALTSSEMRRKISNIATGTSGSMKNITKPGFLALRVLLPPFPEQHKIAETLGTWDKAIALTERRIEAARQRKKGLTQRLLSGRVRLEEFKGESWREVQLGEFLTLRLRKVPKPSTCYSALGVRSHGKGTFTKEVDDPSKVAMTHLYVVREGDLIVNITFAWEGAIALVKESDEGHLVSHRFPTYVFDRNKVDPDFFKYLMMTKQFFYKLGLISPGGAGRNRVMSKKSFMKIKVNLPSLEEQQRYAEVLCCANEEIELLTQKRDALQRQKKGLMQRLLTGRVRVEV